MIRKLLSSDASAYKRLRLLALTTDPDAYFLSYASQAERSEASFGSEISAYAHPFGYIGWFDEQENLQAYVQIAPSLSQKTSHTGDVFNLYVHPEFRSQGIALQLMETALRAVETDSRMRTLFLSVIHTNIAALHLYEELGFTEYGRKNASLLGENGYLDELLMRFDFQR